MMMMMMINNWQFQWINQSGTNQSNVSVSWQNVDNMSLMTSSHIQAFVTW